MTAGSSTKFTQENKHTYLKFAGQKGTFPDRHGEIHDLDKSTA
jgi:hypothetical protein